MRSTPSAQPMPGSGGPSMACDEPVVAAAGTDRRLRAEQRVDELEGRAPVVVEPAHEPRVVDVRRPRGRSRWPRTASWWAFAAGADDVGQQRRVGGGRAHLGPLVVEHPQRVELDAAVGLGVQTADARAQPLAQPGAVVGAVLGVAERGQVQHRLRQAERAVRLVGEGDELGVERRVVGAERLGADLGELPLAAGLRLLVAEHRPGVPELHRQRAALEAGVERRPDRAHGALGPQRERALAAVGEGEHLLAHDVGGLADAAGEQRACPRRRAARGSRSRPGAAAPPSPRGRRAGAPSAAGRSRGRPWAPRAREARPSQPPGRR